MMTIEGLYEGAARAAGECGAFAQKYALLGKAAADHICYKCGSREEFEAMRDVMERHSAYLHQAMISGRPIAYIKLTLPVPTVLGDIWFLELSDQKPDQSQKSGFDHIELYPTSALYEDLVQQFTDGGEHIELSAKAHHTTHDIRLPSGFLIRLEPGALIETIKSEEM